MTVSVFAPAKVNLTLHVTGKRADGYHLLDSLVVFAPVGDELVIRDGNILSLTVAGPEAAGVPADEDNLAMRAAGIFAGEGRGAALVLEKFLPAASGIGGASADAAAVLRGLQVRRSAPAPRPERVLALGADVPMCMASRPCRARGIGEKLDVVSLPPLPAVLVNPRVPVPTGAVFRALTCVDNPPMPEVLPEFADTSALIGWLAEQRNDLEAPALAQAPAIAEVLAALRVVPGCGLARMSGSGATCFGIFGSENEARAAASRLSEEQPGWWVAGGVLGDQSARAMPRPS